MFLLLVIVAGLTGTLCMSLVMWFIHDRGWANADMIRAVGSLLTRRYQNSLLPGLVLHAAAGCIFAIGYVLVIRSVGIASALVIMEVGLAIGAFHGAAMVFIMMAVAEKHPVEHFQKAGPQVGWAHMAGHIAYGGGVGLAIALLGPRLGEITRTLPVP